MTGGHHPRWMENYLRSYIWWCKWQGLCKGSDSGNISKKGSVVLDEGKWVTLSAFLSAYCFLSTLYTLAFLLFSFYFEWGWVKKQEVYSVPWFTSQCLLQSGLGQSKPGSPELSQDLPSGWQGPEHVSHISGTLYQKPGAWTQHLICDAGIPSDDH